MVGVLQNTFQIMILLFFIGSMGSLFLGKNQRLSNYMSNGFAMAASVSGMILSLLKLFMYTQNSIYFRYTTSIRFIDISFTIDNLSAFFILLISIVSFAVSIYSLSYTNCYYQKRNTAFLGFLYNLFILSMILVVTADNMFYFLIVWEIMALISYFLVVFEHEKSTTQKASTLYFIMTHIGTAFIIISFILLYMYGFSHSSGFYQGADFSFIEASGIPSNIKHLIFVFAFIGFGTKAGMVPIHIWIPKAYPVAPDNMTAVMSGVMSKTAVFGMVKVFLCILGGSSLKWGILIIGFGALSTIIGIAYAFIDNNIKRLLAYSSVENMGIILIGLGLSTAAASKGQTLIAAGALAASLFHVFNHSIFKSLLFLGAGAVQYAANTKDMEKLGGLIKVMPYTALFFLTGALSISAIPPFNGFVSEWMTLQALFYNISTGSSVEKIIYILAAAILAMAGALAAASFVKTFGIAFLGAPRTSQAKDAREVPLSMRISMGILSLLCLLLGLAPWLVLRMLDSVIFNIYGTDILSNFKGSTGMVFFTLQYGKSSISPFVIVFVIAALFLIVNNLLRFIRKNTKKREYGTWDCGYIRLNPKMQYTATGFSKPVRIILRGILRPQRELEIEEYSTPYTFKTARYIVSTESIFEKYFYRPIVKNIIYFAKRTRFFIQTGSIHTYFIYMFIAIIFMLVYYTRS